MKYDYLVFIGRFAPFHPGHLSVVKKALDRAEKLILVIGSANRPATFRNPFTVEERIAFIKSYLSDDDLEHIYFAPVGDYTYNNTKWVTAVQSAVHSIVWKNNTNHGTKIGLIGHEKDHSSFYLKMFPMWGSESVPNYKEINATDIRKHLFDTGSLHDYKYYNMAPGQFDLVQDTMCKKGKSVIVDEYHFIQQYKKQWENSPYAPTFVTTDALVVQAGNILVVKRGAMPGEGLYALPGGFLEPGLTLLDNTIKELREETKIKVPEPVLRGSMVKKDTFDDPHRSLRGRTVTTCFQFNLDGTKLEKVKGGDDAANAFWMPLDKVIAREHMFFEDHFDIIQSMLGI